MGGIPLGLPSRAFNAISPDGDKYPPGLKEGGVQLH